MGQTASVKQWRALSSMVHVDLFIKIPPLPLVGVQTFVLATGKPGGSDHSPMACMQPQLMLIPPAAGLSETGGICFHSRLLPFLPGKIIVTQGVWFKTSISGGRFRYLSPSFLLSPLFKTISAFFSQGH